MSLKSIFRVVRRALATARPPRADEADFLGIVVTSPDRVRHHEHAAICGASQA